MVNIIVGTNGRDTLTGINTDNNIIYANEGNDSVRAGIRGDKIYGWTGNDTLIGGDANDAIGGDQDNDSISGGGGDDQLYGGTGEDTISGGIGNDFITGDDGNDSISGNEDNDVVYGGFGNDTISGDAGNDFLSGENGDDSLLGGAGEDELYGIYDNNSYTGGAGKDRFILSPGDATIDANDKIDTIYGFELGTIATGGVVEDTIDVRQLGVSSFTALRALMTNVNGDTRIDFSVEYDRILIIKGVTPDQLFAQHFRMNGDNVAPIAAGDTYTVGKDGLLLASSVLANDTDANGDKLAAGLSTGPSNAALFQFNPDGSFTYQPRAGFEGTDTFTYIANDGSLFSNVATVTITVGNAKDGIVEGTAGNDVINAAFVDPKDGDQISAGNDSIRGLDGNDLITGGAGNDNIDGGNGNDTILGDAGADTMNGNAGFDTADYSASSAAVIVNLANGTGVGGDAAGDTYISIETVVGSAFNDSLLGGSANESLTGGLGVDTLSGGVGNDTLTGGAGDDRFIVESSQGANTTDQVGAVGNLFQNVTGADKIDLRPFASITGFGNLNISGGANTNFVYTISLPGSQTLIVHAEGLLKADDFILNTPLNDGIVEGTAGNDVINATFVDPKDGDKISAGDDIIRALDGNDLITGGAGNDNIDGGNGNDTILGDAGADTMNGNAGFDTADYSASSAAVIVNLANGTGVGGDAAGDTYISIETVVGSAFNDSLLGGSANESLTGGLGVDTLSGGTGNDTLTGGAGDDRFIVESSQGANTTDQVGAVGNLFQNITGADKIDLRPFASITSFGGLSISGGANTNFVYTISLPGSQTLIVHAEGQLKADDFILNVPLNDGIVEGTAGNDVINAAFVDPKDGDKISASNDIIRGLDGDDLITGGAGNDNIDGGNGNDTILGDAGADTMNGNAGFDTADYSASSAAVIVNLANGTGVGGDAAGDTYISIETVVGSAFNDSLLGGTADESLNGGAGNDVIDGNAGNDTMTGGAGDDVFVIGRQPNAVDTINDFQTPGTVEKINLTAFGYTQYQSEILPRMFQVGSDVYINLPDSQIVILKNVQLSTLSADDFVDVRGNDGIVTGTSGNDTIGLNTYVDVDGDKVTVGNDSINAGAGNDVIDGNAGNDTMTGGAGDDVFVIGRQPNAVDTINDFQTPGTVEKINLTAFGYTQYQSEILPRMFQVGSDVYINLPDSQIVILKNVQLSTLSADDFVDVRGNDGIVTGTSGNDTIGLNTYVDVDGDKVTVGNDSINAGAGNDVIDGNAGNDTMTGGAGDDVFVIGRQPNAVDTINDFQTPGTVEKINLTAFGYTQYQSEILPRMFQVGSDVYINLPDSQIVILKNVQLSTLSADDFVDVRGNDGIVTGTSGNDTIGLNTYVDVDGDKVTVGNDSINAGAGNDVIDGNAGNDTMTGGAGDDVFVIGRQPNAVDTINDFQTPGTVEKINLTAFGYTQYQSEILPRMFQVGSDVYINLPDSQIVILKNVQLSTLSADDFVDVRGNDGIVTGTSGNDTIGLNTYVDVDGDKVTVGNDSINAGAGNDVIDGNAGNDTMTGGAGDDVFVIGRQPNAVDTINDFQTPGTVEKINLTAFGYTQYQSEILPRMFQVGSDVYINLPDSQIVILKNVQLSTLSADDFVDVRGNDGIVTGTSGNDTIGLNTYVDVDGDKVTVGNDSINAGAGNDVIDGNAGNDTMTGGAGDDVFVIGRQPNAVDTINDFQTPGTVEKINLTAFGYTQYQSEILPRMFQVGSDVYINLPDSQIVILKNVQLSTLSADDFVDVRGNDGIVTGTSGNDTIGLNTYVDVDGDKVTVGNDSINAGAGNDVIDGNAGNDTMTGGAGDDVFVIGRQPNAVDTINDFQTPGTVEKINLTAFGYTQYQSEILPRMFQVGSDVYINLPDSQIVILKNVQLSTLSADDFVDVRGNDGIVTGTSGNDTIGLNTYVDVDGDKVTVGNDSINAGAGNDVIDGNAGNDTMTGGAGDDVFVIGRQPNAVDTINDFQTPGTVEKINLTAFGYTQYQSEILPRMFQVGSDVYINLPDSQIVILKNVQLSTLSADDFVDVRGNDGIVTGTSGNDTIGLNTYVDVDGDKVTVGNDSINAGAGNDVIDGNAGNDTMTGGAGDDVFVIGRQPNAVDTINDFQTPGTVEKINLTAFGYTQYQSEILPRMFQVGSDVYINLPDSQIVILKNVQLSTLSADDFVDVRGNDGIVTGTSGNDTIGLNTYVDVDGDKVTVGNDSINAGAGNDVIDGNAGNDTMTGGAGDDVFVIGRQPNAVDTINDFQTPGTVEKINLTAFGYTQYQSEILPRMFQVGSDVYINLPDSQIVILKNVQLSTLSADDFVDVRGNDGIVTGTSGNDTIGLNTYVDVDGDKVTVGNDSINAGAGNDVIDGNAGNDTMTGGAGDDVL